ncbi:uncharacterized protein LOC62_01G000125 [Vanrija pseudolonga]|uniref:Uncharacterized protein n=1 Tax=Vanrija pseudolonga TaxID=143232 RepID=A0AAF0XZV8_9TREE|nr:hypothetical protein LOC62_01G000125 [Vanrija pseudolonga]
MDRNNAYGFSGGIPEYTNDHLLTIKLRNSNWNFKYLVTPTPGLGVTRRSEAQHNLNDLLSSVDMACAALLKFTATVQRTSKTGERLPGSGFDRLGQDRIIANITATSQDLLAVCLEAVELTLEVCDCGHLFRGPHPTKVKHIRAMAKMAQRDATLAAFLDTVKRFHHEVDKVFDYAATALQRTRP